MKSKLELRLFFHGLLELAFKYPGRHWDNPCSWLLEEITTKPDQLIERIVNAYDYGEEIRLNGAGLKMWWHIEKDGNERRPVFSIGGDQVKDYLTFAHEARKLLSKLGLGKRPTHSIKKRVQLPEIATKNYIKVPLSYYRSRDEHHLDLPNEKYWEGR
jgi:hypothetical protein